MQSYSINNISVREYFSMEDTSDYDIFIDTLNPSNVFCNKICKMELLTFDEVEVIKKILNDPNAVDIGNMFITCFVMRGSMLISPMNEFLNASVFELFSAKRFIYDYILGILKTESKVLSGSFDQKMIMINANERLRPVSHLLSKIRLAEQFGCLPREVGKWNYRHVFSLMVANHLSAEVQRDYSNQK